MLLNFVNLLSLDFCSQGQVFYFQVYFHLTSVPRVKYFTFTWLLFPGSSISLSLDFCSQGQVFYFHVTSVPRVKYFTLKFWTLFKVLNIEFCFEYWIVCWILNCVDYWTLILNYLPRVVCFCWDCSVQVFVGSPKQFWNNYMQPWPNYFASVNNKS